ncbi:MAG: hypothetical protein L7S43_01860 [Flavobacteriaceae bacterium]|nr:hypothetical protein [Flavobacteriaceae bacterium]
MKIELLFLFISPFCFAQVGIYGDIYISNNLFLPIHTPATHFIDGIVITDPFQPGALKFFKDKSYTQSFYRKRFVYAGNDTEK